MRIPLLNKFENCFLLSFPHSPTQASEYKSEQANKKPQGMIWPAQPSRRAALVWVTPPHTVPLTTQCRALAASKPNSKLRGTHREGRRNPGSSGKSWQSCPACRQAHAHTRREGPWAAVADMRFSPMAQGWEETRPKALPCHSRESATVQTSVAVVSPSAAVSVCSLSVYWVRQVPGSREEGRNKE